MACESEPNPEERFRGIFEATYADLCRFVERRVHPSHVEDVVAEVFLVAWRRLDDLPSDHGDLRAFLFGIARGTLMNTVRGARRQQALALRLAAVTPSPVADDRAQAVVDRVAVAGAWQRLTLVQQESLALIYWDDLTGPQAAAVLGISPVAFRLRLTRARRALRAALELPAAQTIRPTLTPAERSTP